MTSGLSTVASLSASSPSAALPTTSTSGWSANTSAMLRRLYAESSTTSSRMGAAFAWGLLTFGQGPAPWARALEGLSVHEVVPQM